MIKHYCVLYHFHIKVMFFYCKIYRFWIRLHFKTTFHRKYEEFQLRYKFLCKSYTNVKIAPPVWITCTCLLFSKFLPPTQMTATYPLLVNMFWHIVQIVSHFCECKCVCKCVWTGNHDKCVIHTGLCTTRSETKFRWNMRKLLGSSTTTFLDISSPSVFT